MRSLLRCMQVQGGSDSLTIGVISLNTVKIMIDGIETEIVKGTTVLEAARDQGINIPSLCYLQELIIPPAAGSVWSRSDRG